MQELTEQSTLIDGQFVIVFLLLQDSLHAYRETPFWGLIFFSMSSLPISALRSLCKLQFEGLSDR